MKHALFAACLLAVAACAAPEEPRQPPVAIAPTMQPYVPGESAIYCYSTLADGVCSSEPQGGPPNRLVGAYTDRPQAPLTE